MNRHRLLGSAFVVASALAVSTGCSSGGQGSDDPSSEDALVKSDLKDYGMAAGVIATGPTARKLYEDIKANEGTDLGNHAVLAGVTGAEAGFTDPDDAKTNFGVSCQTKEGDATFRADTCSLYAIVKIAEQEKKPGGGYVLHLSGKIARGVAGSLPLTSPRGVVGGSTSESSGISCKTIPGPVGSKCTMQAFAVVASFDEMMRDPESKLKAADARKIIKAFF